MGVFRSRFLPDHEMTVKPNDFSLRPARVDAPTDYSLIDRWFDHVRKQQVGPPARGPPVNEPGAWIGPARFDPVRPGG